MWYLFFQMFLWLLLAFALGLVLGYWLCSKCEKRDNSNTKKQLAPAVKRSTRKNTVKKKKDDLKKIKGIGAVLEKKLNKLEITEFAQIADFTKKDITGINKTLSFQGRIEREKWVSQAKKLVKSKG